MVGRTPTSAERRQQFTRMKTKLEARRAALVLKKKLEGRGWKIRVWENIGWHYAVETDRLSVNEYPDHSIKSRFSCMLKPHFTLFGPVAYAANPNQAVEKLLESARDHIEEYKRMVDDAFTVYAK